MGSGTRREGRDSFKRRTIMGALMLLVMVFPGCVEGLVENYRYGEIEVSAVTDKGVPVEGVDMVLHRGGQHLAYGTTDGNGRHVFTFVPFGALGIVANLPEPYLTPELQSWIVVEQLMMEPGGNLNVVLGVILCGSSIRVRVIDDLGTPVAGVPVDLYQSTGILDQGETDEAGELAFLEVPCGNLGVGIGAPPGYRAEPGRGGTYMDGLIAGPDSQFDIEFVLTRVSE